MKIKEMSVNHIAGIAQFAAAARRAEGFTFVAIGSDSLLLAAGVATAMRQARGET